MEQYRALLRAMRRLLPGGQARTAKLPFLRACGELAGGREPFLHAALALEVFAERGLVRVSEAEGGLADIALLPWESGVDLFACPLLQRLRTGPVYQEGRKAQ